MDSDGDEDFVAAAPTTKKTKKNTGEDKGKKKKKESVSKDPVEPSSPKRKTPKRKNEPKEESKKGKAKGKAKKSEDDPESTAIGEEDEFNDETENLNPNDESQDFKDDEDDEDFEEKEKSKKKSVTKSEKKVVKPKKEKAGAAKDTDQDEILEYMKKQNRPYSIINIFDNLHGKIAKKNMQKALDTLTEDGLLQAKEFGKNKVWLLNQQNIPQVNAKELSDLTENLNAIKKEHDKLADEVKEMTSYLKNLQNQLSNEDLDNEITKYQKLVEESGEKLSQFESGNYPQISDEDMKKAEDKKKQMETECKKRKKMCMEMLNSLADGMDVKVANIMEMIGIEIEE